MLLRRILKWQLIVLGTQPRSEIHSLGDELCLKGHFTVVFHCTKSLLS